MSRWDEYDEPVLRAIYQLKKEAIDKGGRVGDFMDGAAIAERSGVAGSRLADSLLKLADDGLIIGAPDGLREAIVPQRITPEGLRALREWPGSETLADMLPALLEALAERTDDPEQKTWLQRAADVAQSVTAATLAAVVQEVSGLR